jgi:phosphocarrier protein
MTEADDSAPIARDFLIVNKRGLHARAAARFVQCVEGFEAAITVSKDQATVDGFSIMGLMMLAAGKGSSVRVAAKGADAEAALDAIGELIASRFGEDD